jgi:cholesterol transport system auxiliary component
MSICANGCACSGRLALLALVALACGCTALQPPQVESPNLYVLAAEPLRKAVRAPRDVVVEVTLPRAWPGFDTAQIVYVRRPYELDYFAASRWADTPARMLEPLLARALEQTGSFRAVVQTPSAVPADVRVDTELVRLQQHFGAPPSRVELTLRVQLTDVRGRRVVAARVFEETENAPSEDAAGGVVATNAALQRILEQVADFCVAESAER